MRFTRWAVALLSCLVAFQGYAWLVVPAIEPPPQHLEPQDRPPVETLSELPDELHDLLPPDAWEFNNPMVLKTRWGELLFQDHKQIKEGIELFPCTILLFSPTSGQDGQRGERLIVLQTPEKAVLHLDGEINLIRGQIGKLKNAYLNGPVIIRSAETRDGANDALSIVTRNIQISPKQIWTRSDVAFEYGASRGSGRILNIMLADSDSNVDTARGTKSELAKHVQELQLTHVDGLRLDFPGTGLLGDQLGANPADESSASSAAQSTMVDVTCKGIFRFDFRKGVATLYDEVDVVRFQQEGQDDQLRCDELRIHFATDDSPDESGKQDSRPAPSQETDTRQNEDPGVVGKLKVRRIEAVGADVLLDAPSIEVAARGELLQYDFQTRRILLKDSGRAAFTFRKHLAQSPCLEYELAPEPKRLGRLWATGPGLYRGVLGKDKKSLQVAWQGMLELQPQDQLHVLSVVQGADMRWGELGTFRADKLFVWLKEAVIGPVEIQPAIGDALDVRAANFETPDATAAGPGPLLGPAAPAPPKTTKTKVEVVPIKMLAQGNVRADFEQFNGDTSQLEIWFDRPASQTPQTAGETPSASGGAGIAPAPEDSPAESSPTKREDKRLELSGTQIRVRLWMTKPEPIVREATVLGNVRLAQAPAEPDQPNPLLVTGTMLQLRTDQLERSSIDVSGTEEQPARVHAQGMLLEGSNLHVSQRENLMWSTGPGRTRLPARAPKPNPAGTPPGRFSANGPIWISWQGGMDFDGQLIRFMDRVEVSGIYTSNKGEQLYLRSTGDKLHVTLNRYVEFAKTKNTDGLDVVELRFLGEVYTQNETFGANNALTSQDFMRARDLTFDRRSGKFTATGPGWITTTRVENDQLRGRLGAPAPSPAVNRATGTSEQRDLIYLRIDFENAIEGNLDLREAVFNRAVRTVYGPVKAWDQKLDPDQRGGLGPDGIVMNCNQLKIVEMGQGEQRALELSALGNTIVEGRQFLATADRITYVEAKDQLILQASGNNFVRLRQQSRAGGDPAELQARKIIYGIRSGIIEKVEGAYSASYDQLGSPNTIPPARIR
jgi:hypothetical protein